MFEEFRIVKNVGCLAPMPVVDNIAHEFYALAPKNIMLSVIPMGVEKFTREEVEEIMKPLDEQLEHFIIRKVDLVQHSGVPLLLAIGIERHDDRLKRIEDRVGCPATSSLTGAVAAAKRLGIRRLAFANNFPPELNEEMRKFFERDGIAVVGFQGRIGPQRDHAAIKRIDSLQHMHDAHAHCKRGLDRFPDCDGLYMGGGSARLTPVVAQLEKEYGKPVIGHQDAMAWDILTRLGCWRPVPGFGRLLASA